MKKILISLCALATFLILASSHAKADGGIFYPGNSHVYESGQKALIYYNEGTEDLVVQPSYEGNAKDFVWVVPTPNEPKVEKSSNSVFTALQRLTTSDDIYVGNTMPMDSLSAVSTSKEVQIIEEKTIDSFDVVTLKATSETALSDWMKENKYSFPESKNYLLSDYINNGWYFVISKIRPEAEADVQDELNSGTITPLRFTFKSDKIIYPMKLTKVAMEQDENAGFDQPENDSSLSLSSFSGGFNYGSSITLYVLADNRVENSAFNTAWAGWIKPLDIKKITAESTEKNWLQVDKKLFLSKMSQYYYADQIDDDVVLSKYKNNDSYPVPFYKQSYYWSGMAKTFAISVIGFLLSPIFLLFIIFSLKQKHDPKWLRLGWWLKVLIVSLPLLLVASALLIFQHYSSKLIEDGGVVGVLTAFLMFEIVLAVLIVRDYARLKTPTSENLAQS